MTYKLAPVERQKLAKLMIEWFELHVQITSIETDITNIVLRAQETITTGAVVASYTGGRRSFDYEKTAQAFEDAIKRDTVIEEHTTKITPEMVGNIIKQDWKAVVEDLGIDEKKWVVKSKTDPSVNIKLEI